MIVVDSNVIAYLLLPGEWTEAAEALLENHPLWAAPPLWRSEFRNILAGYLRRGTLAQEQALALQCAAEELLTEIPVDSRAVLELVRQSACSAYDCEFVALARQIRGFLYTMDSQLLAAFPDTAKPLQKPAPQPQPAPEKGL